MADQAQWFDPLGTCVCGHAATGTLRGPRNDSYGTYCKRCADRRLAKAKREREREALPGATTIGLGQ